MVKEECAVCMYQGVFEYPVMNYCGYSLMTGHTKLKLTVYLCPWCHQYDADSVHRSGETRLILHKYGQRKAMIEQGWSKEDFIREFGKNYLDDDEIAALYDVPTDGHFALIREEAELPW